MKGSVVTAICPESLKEKDGHQTMFIPDGRTGDNKGSFQRTSNDCVKWMEDMLTQCILRQRFV